MYIDTHCHMDFADFDSDRMLVIENGVREGVSAMVNAGTDISSSRFSVELARKCAPVKAAVGIHPSEVKNADSRSMDEIEKLASENNVAGIGETGLDFHYGKEFAQKQKEFLILHMRLACKLNMPLIVHQRDSRDEIIEIFEKEKTPERVVFHCFGGDRVLADYCREKGFYISFSGIITFKKAFDVKKVCSEYPLERIMAETDAPFLAPAPFRGKRNDPSKVRYIVEEISNVRPEGAEECRERIFDNSKRFFRI
jgi:TatD DNase family protein